VFLFKYREEKDTRPVLSSGAPGVFFAKQVVTNACATQAIISILMNRPELQLGEVLDEYRSFTGLMDPEIRGIAIGNSPEMRTIHNSFARPEPFQMETRVATSDDDVYHFIAYVPVGGVLYELDGLKAGPIRLGACTEANWTDVAKPVIRERMERYSQSETGFNLLALIEDQQVALTRKLAELKHDMTELQAAMTDDPDIQQEISRMQAEQAALTEDLTRETKQRADWTAENIRRRHNYIPFLFQLMTALAQKGKLNDLVEQGKKSTQDRLAAAYKTSSTQ
jgi:ubiquitin carboxyl-terminal hydrolase L5